MRKTLAGVSSGISQNAGFQADCDLDKCNRFIFKYFTRESPLGTLCHASKGRRLARCAFCQHADEQNLAIGEAQVAVSPNTGGSAATGPQRATILSDKARRSNQLDFCDLTSITYHLTDPRLETPEGMLYARRASLFE